MKPEPLRYERPADLAGAVSLLGEQPGARVLAGGQSLMAALRLREQQAPCLVDVTRLGELRGISVERDAVVIGAGEPMLDVEHSDVVRTHLPLLARVLRTVGAVGVRSRATLGGSLAWSEPTSQLLAALLALGVQADTDRRTLAGADLPTGRNRNALERDEVLVRLRFPRDARGNGGLHIVRRTHLTWPTLGAVATRTGNGVRLAVFGVAPRPVVVEGIRPEATVEEAVAQVDPYDDERAPAAYRRRVAPVVARRALAELVA